MVKPIATKMGNGRGAFRKAFLSVLLYRHVQKKAGEKSLKELGDECAYCGISGEVEHLGNDHLWPESKGGLYVLGNVLPCCPTCNSSRRDLDWEEYLKTSPRVKANRNKRQIRSQIMKIKNYMKRHGQDQEKVIEKVLTRKERKLRKDFDLLLAALSDSAIATAGIEKKAAIQFKNPDKLFNELVKVAERYKIKDK